MTAEPSFVHLHVHSEYSLLDGAARIEAPKFHPDAPTIFTEAARHGMSGGGRHGSRRHVRRAPLLRGRARRRHQADHRRRGLRRAGVAVRAEPGRERGEVPPPHAPGGERDGLPEPAEARVRRLPGGLLPPAAHGQGAARRARRGRRSACRDVCRASCRRCCSPGRIAARRRRPGATATSSVPIASSWSCRITASRTSAACSRSRSRSPGPSTSRSSRRTTSTTRCKERREAARRAALHPAAEAPERSEATEVRLGGVLPEERRRRCGASSTSCRRRATTRCGSRSGSSSTWCTGTARRPSSGSTCRGSRRRIGKDLEEYLRELVYAGAPDAVPHAHGRHPPPDRRRAGRHHPDGVRGLLPDRVGPDPVRARERDPRGAGPRLGGRLRRVVLPADHRPRSAALRPDLRAVPEPRPPIRCRTSTWTSTSVGATR